MRIAHFTYVLLKYHHAKTTFADSLNTFQSDKEHGMTDRKALVPQLTERKLSVMTRTCHCSDPIWTLLTSSAFNYISLWEVPFPCTYMLAECLSSSLHCFPPGPADTSSDQHHHTDWPSPGKGSCCMWESHIVFSFSPFSNSSLQRENKLGLPTLVLSQVAPPWDWWSVPL